MFTGERVAGEECASPAVVIPSYSSISPDDGRNSYAQFRTVLFLHLGLRQSIVLPG